MRRRYAYWDLEEFKKVSAELSIKLQINFEKTWTELQTIEKDAILNEIDEREISSSERYKELKKLLSIFEKLKKPFQLQNLYFWYTLFILFF